MRDYSEWPGGGVRWHGVTVLKQPVDLLLQQELIWDTKPDLIVETGTKYGGSANFYADQRVEVISVDVACPKPPATHFLVTYLNGYSTDPSVFYFIEEAARGRRVMVVLDSDHSRDNVLAELDMYAPLVSTGCYLIVEDTALGGPQEALDMWLPAHPDFRVNTTIPSVEHANGYLYRWN